MAAMRDHWSQGAEAYASFSGQGGLRPLHEKVLDIVSDGAAKRTQLLDIACGDGEPACSLARQHPVAQLTATDYAPGMVEIAEKKAQSLGIQNIRFAVADAMDLSDYADNSFDLVTCVAALFMVPDYNKALQEFHRVLRPGGLLVATTWGTPEETNIATVMQTAKLRVAPQLAQPTKRTPNLDPSRLANPALLQEIVAAAGFHNATVERFNIEFKFPKAIFDYPDGPMLRHPMTTLVAAQLKEAGITNPVKALTEQLPAVYAEGGYEDGPENVHFPTNLANIVVATA